MGAAAGSALWARTASSVESTPPEKRMSTAAGARAGAALPPLPAAAALLDTHSPVAVLCVLP